MNELNTIPGFTATSVFASLDAACRTPELLDRLLGSRWSGTRPNAA